MQLMDLRTVFFAHTSDIISEQCTTSTNNAHTSDIVSEQCTSSTNNNYNNYNNDKNEENEAGTIKICQLDAELVFPITIEIIDYFILGAIGAIGLRCGLIMS